MAEQKMVKKPTTRIVKDATGSGYACNGCGLKVLTPVKVCPCCGDSKDPVFRKLE